MTVLPRCIARLERISSYFESYQERRAGSLQCDKHYHVTHYGKLAYLLRIDGFLFQRTQNEEYLRRALRMLERLQGQLRFDEGKYIFYPGLLNKYNGSNNAIDSGGITDCLAYWYERFADVTPSAQLAFIRDACSKVARTYLRFTGGKLTNQALWAMTGLAAVYRSVEPEEEYRAACLESLQQSFRDQNEDGSFPYLPRRLAGQDSPSLHDVSGFYHSRHLSFILDVADKIGYPIGEGERERILKAADFLCALYRPDGSKSLEIEAKHWYWMGDVQESGPVRASTTMPCPSATAAGTSPSTCTVSPMRRRISWTTPTRTARCAVALATGTSNAPTSGRRTAPGSRRRWSPTCRASLEKRGRSRSLTTASRAASCAVKTIG